MDIKQVDLKSALQSQYLIRKKILEGCQRIARRDKKGFLSDQCKEIEENNRMERLDTDCCHLAGKFSDPQIYAQ